MPAQLQAGEQRIARQRDAAEDLEFVGFNIWEVSTVVAFDAAFAAIHRTIGAHAIGAHAVRAHAAVATVFAQN